MTATSGDLFAARLAVQDAFYAFQRCVGAYFETSHDWEDLTAIQKARMAFFAALDSYESTAYAVGYAAAMSSAELERELAKMRRGD